MEGYVKIYRKLIDNPIIFKDNDHLAVWMYLLLNATHKPIKAFFKDREIVLQRGQLITGRKKIAEKLNINESKVQRILKLFECEHQIEQQTGTKNRLISIVKWDEYQIGDINLNNNRTTSEQQVNTNKNIKNIRNNIISFSNKEIKEPTDDPLLKEYLNKHKEEGNTEDLIEQYFWEGLS